MARKKAAEEIDEGPAIPVINQFIDTELARPPAIANTLPKARSQLIILDTFLHDVRTKIE